MILPFGIHSTNVKMKKKNLLMTEKVCKELEIEQEERILKTIDEKTCIRDIRVLLNENRQINLEMQMGSLQNWTDRLVFYLCKMFTDLKKGLDYTQTKQSIHIRIMMDSPVSEDAAFYNEYA